MDVGIAGVSWYGWSALILVLDPGWLGPFGIGDRRRYVKISHIKLTLMVSTW